MLERDNVIKRQFYKGIIGKCAWSFSYNSFVKFRGKKLGSHNMMMFYPNLFYNDLFYKEIALYFLSETELTSFSILACLACSSCRLLCAFCISS